MVPPVDLDRLSRAEHKIFTIQILEENAELRRALAAAHDEIARLKGCPGRPNIKPSKPSGMEKATEPKSEKPSGEERPKRGPTNPKLTIDEHRTVEVTPPPGSRFKGYTSFIVQDLIIRTNVVEYRCERWLTPDGTILTAPLPDGVQGHFGPELVRYVIHSHYHGQVTMPRLVEMLQDIGIVISKRQVVRLLNEDNEPFVNESDEVLRAGLSNAPWISVDDTGARHKAKNGYCTQIGNAHFTWFGTTYSKSRANFLGLLRAGYNDYVINAEALAYMRQRNLAEHVITRLAEHPDQYFADQDAWTAHLKKLGITKLKIKPKSVEIATEGALWGSIKAHGLLPNTVIVSDDAGQFNVGDHGLCWVHAERLIHKLDTFTDKQRKAQRHIRSLIWHFYRALKAYKLAPSEKRKASLTARFDRIFTRRTGFVALNHLLKRLHDNKAELLKVLERPEIPLNTNISENDVRCHVTKRKISGGTRSDLGRRCRDVFLSHLKTCKKLAISFWDYLGARLSVPDHCEVPYLPDLVKHRCASG